MHYWGDDWFEKYGDDLNRAINYFTDNVWKYGRIWCFSKEKYGTMRLDGLYYGFGYFEIGKLFFKTNYLFIHSPKIYWVDQHITYYFAKYLFLNRLTCMYQRFIFNLVTLQTIKKWPHLLDEITDEYEFNTLLYDWIKRKINYVNHWVSV